MSPEMSAEEVRRQYDEVGDAYVEAQARFIAANGDFATDFLVDAIGNIREMELLDIGCGAGDQLELYASAGADVYGVEPSVKMLDSARRKVNDSGRKVLHGGAENLSWNDNRFDVVTSRLSLNYVHNLDVAWEQIGRVLRPNGLLAFVAPHPFGVHSRILGDPDYHETKLTTYTLFGEVEVTNYTHSFDDFFSSAFLERFSIENFTEFPGVVARTGITGVPSAFGVKARRKE